MVRIPLKHLERMATVRPANYVDDVLRAGEIDGPEIVLSEESYQTLLQKYSPPGLGDAVAFVLKPIAGFLRLEDCGGCAERQDALNRAFPLDGKSNGTDG